MEYENLLSKRNSLEEECKKYKELINDQTKTIKQLYDDIEQIKASYETRKTEVVVKQEKLVEPQPEPQETQEAVEESANISLLVDEATIRHPVSISLFIEIMDDSVIVSTAFSPDGKNLAIGADKVLRIYNFDQDNFILGEKVGDQDTQSSHVRSISWSPDSRKVICGVEDKRVYIFKIDPTTENGSCLEHSIAVPDQHIFQVMFLPDGKRFAVSTGPGIVQIWDVNTYQMINKFARQTDQFAISMALAPDQKTLAVGYADYYVAFWDIEAGKLLFDQKCHDEGVNSILFTPDAKRLITSSLDNTVKIWDIRPNGLELWKVLDKHTDYVLTLAMDPKGEWLISGSRDLSCIVSYIPEGRMIYKLKNHENTVMAVSFNPNGRQFCTGSGDKYVKVWNFITDQTE
ncbi:Transcriptional repressor tup11-related protein [Trichomonas vaginalis G3]|uniref:Transcriptional repressor tup11-related protein n=2 Tax=Trichomonas vaginalis (strain ATCC PRA-98 / G3) TaxID=412133 RepID=A2DAK8_TRIV3|nr:Transcriptional repressor tup11-related protein [Trichomonas vaginalis G3]|eukprot:XP_001583497.1 Transcriptional repressor tup11-related protein [Trichomonas vaginalis G3]